MVMIFRWDRARHLTHANVDMTKMPLHPYETKSLRGTFPDDVVVASRTKPIDFMEVGSFMFVSHKVKAILEDHQVDVEFYSVTLTYRRQDNFGWSYLHPLVELDCLDPEKTIRSGRDHAMPEMIKSMVLIESVCGGTPWFRIGDSPQIGVSDALASAFKDARCKGALFQAPEEWRNPGLYYE